MRYARALLEVSQKDADPDRVEAELSGFCDLMESHPKLGIALVSPSIPVARKQSLVDAVTSLMGDVLPVTRRFLMLLADRDRLPILAEVLGVYRDELMKQHGVLKAEITTASELSRERIEVIAKTLGSAAGKQVDLETEVDPTLLGGMVTRIGSTVYDGSIAGHLGRLRKRFLNEA